MEYRTVEQRLDDLEHDNNLLRRQIAELWTAESMTRASIDQNITSIEKRVVKLVNSVNDFVGKFGRVN